jgi:DNA-binding transcriptional MocR family regulator
VQELADCARAALEQGGAAALNYGPVGGYGPLREWIAEWHGVEPGRVLVTNGSLEGLNLLFERFAARSRILVEAPTYDRVLRIARRLGVELVAIGQDGDGLDVDALEAELDRDPAPAFLYALPTFQNPSGRTLSLERRRRLVELASTRELTVLEDDPYGLLRFEGDALPTLFELDGGEKVLRTSSFSKIVAPGMRVGYLVLPSELAAEVEAVAADVYLAPSFVSEATLHEFLVRGRLEPNVERVRLMLRERRDAMLGALEQNLPGAGWSRPEGGYFVWLDLPGDADAGDLLGVSERAGVSFVKGSDFFPGESGGRASARLAFSHVSPDEIGEGIARLAALAAETVPA